MEVKCTFNESQVHIQKHIQVFSSFLNYFQVFSSKAHNNQIKSIIFKFAPTPMNDTPMWIIECLYDVTISDSTVDTPRIAWSCQRNSRALSLSLSLSLLVTLHAVWRDTFERRCRESMRSSFFWQLPFAKCSNEIYGHSSAYPASWCLLLASEIASLGCWSWQWRYHPQELRQAMQAQCGRGALKVHTRQPHCHLRRSCVSAWQSNSLFHACAPSLRSAGRASQRKKEYQSQQQP